MTPSTTTPAATTRFSPLGRRLLVPVAIALLFAATIVFLVTRTGGTLVGDTTSHVTATELLPQMEPGDAVVQPVVASDDRLAAVQVRFGTYMGAADCTVRVSLHEDDGRPTTAQGDVIASAEWECGALIDSAPMDVLTFEPLEGSAGERYDVVVERVDDRDTPGVVVWAGAPRGEVSTAAVNGRADDLSADIRTLYDPQPRWWDQLDVITERMAAYGPAWGTAGAFAGLLVLLGLLVAGMPLLTRSPRAFLVLVAVVAVVRGLVWSAAVPAFGGMDEPAHFANVQFMAEEQELPGQDQDSRTYSEQVWVAHELLNLTSSPPGDRPDYTPEAEARITEQIDAASQLGGGGGPAGIYPPVYYAPAALLAAASGDAFFSQLMAARMWSVLLGAAAAVLTALIGRRTFPGRPGAQVAFAAAGVLQPMLSHQFAIVNNDAWVMVAGFTGLLVALELARRARAPRLALLAGVVIGAALLGKPFGAAVAVPLAVGWLVGKVRGRVRSVKDLATEAGLVVLGVAVTYGAWRVVAAVLGIASQSTPVVDGAEHTLREFAAAQVHGARWFWGSQLWGNFGWVRIPFPETITTLIFAGLCALAVGVVAWVVVLVVERRRPRASSQAVTAAVADDDGLDEIPLDARILVHVAAVLGMAGTLYAAAWLYYVSTGQNDLLQGRYALMALPAILALPGLLLERLSRGRVSPLVANAPVAVAMGVLTLLGLKRVLEGFYG